MTLFPRGAGDAVRLLNEILQSVAARGIGVQVAGDLPNRASDVIAWSNTADLDRAMERAEDAVLAAHGGAHQTRLLTLADHPVCAGLSTEEVAELESMTSLHEFASGQVICRPGDVGSSAYLVLAGQVLVATGPRPEDTRLRSSARAQSWARSACSLASHDRQGSSPRPMSCAARSAGRP